MAAFLIGPATCKVCKQRRPTKGTDLCAKCAGMWQGQGTYVHPYETSEKNSSCISKYSKHELLKQLKTANEMIADQAQQLQEAARIKARLEDQQKDFAEQNRFLSKKVEDLRRQLDDLFNPPIKAPEARSTKSISVIRGPRKITKTDDILPTIPDGKDHTDGTGLFEPEEHQVQ